MRQLGDGVTAEVVDNARELILEAAALRPVDEDATKGRLIVLAGLDRIKQATEFNARVAQRAQNGTDGVTIFQAGISPKSVAQAIADVNKAKQFVEVAPRPIKQPELNQETPLPANESAESELIEEESADVPVFLLPNDPISIRAEADAIADKPKKLPTRGLSRRGLLQYGGVSLGLGTLATVGQVTKVAPIIDWAVDLADLIDGHPKTPAQAEAFFRNYSLTEKPIKLNDWNVSYPVLMEGEEFVDSFNNFSQLYNGGYITPIFAPVGDGSFPLHVTDTNILFEVYESKFFNPLVMVRGGYDSRSNESRSFAVSGRKIPEIPEQRPYPDVIQIESIYTNSSFYLKVKPKVIEGKNKVEIRYMKKQKKSPQELDNRFNR